MYVSLAQILESGMNNIYRIRGERMTILKLQQTETTFVKKLSKTFDVNRLLYKFQEKRLIL